jgi:EmrB/QacA subfamily drug resistance transporter
MLIVDVVVVNVALPAIRTSLALPDAQLPLLSIAYTLTFGSLLIVSGRAGDLFGRRRLFVAGVALFTTASLLAGLAQVGWQLFAARALQGVGAALVAPTSLALLMSAFADGPPRNRALGLWAAVGSAGAIAGQVLGGLVTSLFGWPWIFWLNVPLGILVCLAAGRLLPESRAVTERRLDVTGTLLLTPGLAALALGLGQLADGAPAAALGGFALSLALLTAFLWRERRHPAPLVRLDLARRRGVGLGNLILALLAGSLAATLFFTTLYLQTVLGLSPLLVGFAFAPITCIVLVVSPLAGQLIARWGARALLLGGTVLTAGGMLWLARLSASGSYLTDVLPGLALVALGNGLALAPTMLAGTSGVAERDHGLVSGLLNTSQELGAALGLAALAAVAASFANGHLAPADAVPGFRAGLLGAAGLVAVAWLCAWRLPRGIGQVAPAPEAPAFDHHLGFGAQDVQGNLGNRLHDEHARTGRH